MYSSLRACGVRVPQKWQLGMSGLKDRMETPDVEQAGSVGMGDVVWEEVWMMIFVAMTISGGSVVPGARLGCAEPEDSGDCE